MYESGPFGLRRAWVDFLSYFNGGKKDTLKISGEGEGGGLEVTNYSSGYKPWS